VLSNNTANSLLPTVFALPVVVDAPHMPALAVALSSDAPLPGCAVVVYQAKPVYRPWLVERVGSVTEPTLRSVFAVMVGYLDRWSENQAGNGARTATHRRYSDQAGASRCRQDSSTPVRNRR
jgi:hypothetical protein